MTKKIILNRNAARSLDKLTIEDYGIPGIVLMENAGLGVVDYFLANKLQGNVVICCGKGNNAGDGFVIARHLDNHNVSVHVLLFEEPSNMKGDAKINCNITIKSGIPITIIQKEEIHKIIPFLSKADLIVDALFGTGLQGQIRAPFDTIIQLINESNKMILSIDIPSGLDCDTGEPLGIAIKAGHTFSMIGFKKGFSNPKAKEYLGKIHIIDIGTPKILKQQLPFC